jgi:PAS domain S-box-containing protein
MPEKKKHDQRDLILTNIADVIDILDAEGNRLPGGGSPPAKGTHSGKGSKSNCLDRIAAQDRAAVVAALTDVWKTGEVRSLEVKEVDTDGSSRIVEMIWRPLRGTDGEMQGILAIRKDITRWWEAERSQQMLAHALTSIRDFVTIADLGERILYVNQAFLEAYGYSEAEIIGQHISLVDVPNADPRLRKDISEGTTHGGWNGEVVNRRKDGREFPVELWTSIIPAENGKPLALLGIARDISARTSAEKALRRSEERYRAYLERTSEGIWSIEFDEPIPTTLPAIEQVRLAFDRGYYAECNDPLAKMHGLNSASEIEGRRLADMDDRGSPSNREKLLACIKAGYTLFDAESVESDAAGHRRTFLNNLVGIVEDDLLIRMWGTRRDITERRWNEQLQSTVYRIAEISDAAETLDELYSRAHQVIKDLMPADNFYIALYDANRNMLSFPYFVDEVDLPSPPRPLGHGLTEYVLRTGESLLCGLELFEDMQRRGETSLIGSPSEIWLGVPLIVNRKIIGAMVVQDYRNASTYGQREQRFFEFVSSQMAKVIYRKQTEEALKKSLSLSSATLESTADGILVVDREGRVVGYNMKFVEMWRIPAAIVQSHDDSRLLEAVTNQLREPGQFIAKVRYLYDHPMEVSSDTLDFRDGRVFERYSQPQIVDTEAVGRVWSFRDVTEHRRLEEQLLVAQKMEGIGTLAGGIAHDFNNLLQIILAHSTMILKKKEDAAIVESHALNVEKAVQRGAALVRQLLTFATKSNITLAPVDLVPVIEDFGRMLTETFPKTISLALQMDHPAPVIHADANQLHQALLNLCVNSRDAMPKGGVLTIRVFETTGSVLRERILEAQGDSYVSISVRDSGEGMGQDIVDRIFEPFFTTKGLGQGTGLGLAVVYGIVKSHDGFVEVESRPGEGTTFLLHFPSVTAERVVPAEPVVEHQESGHGTETILVVEDEELLLEVIRSFLGEFGYTILTATDGQQAVDIYAANKEKIALVLSDMGLPKIGGWDVFKIIRTMNPRAKVILASGFLDPKVREEMVELGAIDFIQKPYQPFDTLQMIRRVLDDKM